MINVFISVVIDNNHDEMIEALNSMGYSPREYNTGEDVKTYSTYMTEEDMIMLKLLAIPGSHIYINQADED